MEQDGVMSQLYVLVKCVVCNCNILADDPSCYTSVEPYKPMKAAHKRCAMHNHHSRCKCGLTDAEAEALGCDSIDVPKNWRENEWTI